MRLLAALFRALSILAIVGLVSSSLTAPAVAGRMGVIAAAMASAASADAAGAMSDDMPCCPTGKAPLPDCQKACPLAALCLPKCAGSAVAVTYAVARVAHDAGLSAGNQAVPDGPHPAPLPKPPKS